MTIELVPETPEPDEPLTPSSSFAASLPEDSNFLAGDPSPSNAGKDGAEPTGATFGQSEAPTASDQREKRTRRIKLSRKMQKSMDKIRGIGSDALVMWFHDQARQQPEWELDEKEEEWLRDSMETVFEVLDIELQVEPITATLTSVWWVIAYPVCAFTYLFFMKKSKIAKPEEPQP
jgi:hypothetical protein